MTARKTNGEAEGSVAVFLDSLHTRGVSVRLRGNKLAFAPYGLNDQDRAFVREHRDALKAAIRGGYTPPVARPVSLAIRSQRGAHDAEPVVTVNGTVVTDAQVRESMSRLGDHALADYVTGGMSKARAYEMTRIAMTQVSELRRRRL